MRTEALAEEYRAINRKLSRALDGHDPLVAMAALGATLAIVWQTAHEQGVDAMIIRSLLDTLQNACLNKDTHNESRPH